MVTAVMEDFDFDKVHRVMASLDNGTLALQFILTESTSDHRDYINVEED